MISDSAPAGTLPVRDARIEKGNRLAGWLREHGHRVDFIPFTLRGTDEVEWRLRALLTCAQRVCVVEGRPCTAELIPSLMGKEGRWVTLIVGGKRGQYLIGRSADWLTYHVAKTDAHDPGVPLQRLEFAIAS